MSTTHTYSAQPRTDLGKHAAAKLRTAGQVPVTVSRRGQPSLHLQIDAKQAGHLAANVVHLCTIEAAGAKTTVLKGEVVRDCLKDYIQHIDLVAVDSSSEIRVDVAVVPDARNCPGVKAGGIVEQRLRKVKVKCKADAIPDAIALNLDAVQIMQTVYAKTLTLPAGVTLLTSPKLPVLSVVIPRGMKKDDAVAAAAAAPAGDAKAAPAAGAAAAPAKGAAAAAPAKDAKKK